MIAENLHTDKKEEDEVEVEGEEGEKEEVALGRERMSRIQSMFSGEGGGEEPSSPSFSVDCTELRDEGLVATNLHRFTTGNLRRTSQDSQVGRHVTPLLQVSSSITSVLPPILHMFSPPLTLTP